MFGTPTAPSRFSDATSDVLRCVEGDDGVAHVGHADLSNLIPERYSSVGAAEHAGFVVGPGGVTVFR